MSPGSKSWPSSVASSIDPFDGVPASLIIDHNVQESSLLSDMPFIALGSIAFAVVAFMLVTKTMTRTSAGLVISVLSAFVAAILDVAKVIVLADSEPIGVFFPLLLSREIFLAISLGAKFFYVWRLSGESAATIMVNGNPYTTSWQRWGLAGAIANGTLLLIVVAIGITQAIWRIGILFLMTNGFIVYDLDAVLEIAASALLALKLLANIWLTPPFRPWKAFKLYFPLIFSTLLGFVTPIGNILAFMFSETPYGRLVEAVQLYIYVLVLLFVTMYPAYQTETRPRAGSDAAVPLGRPRAGSLQTVASFQGLSRPVSVDPSVCYPSPAPLMESPSLTSPARSPEIEPISSDEKLSEWVSQRVIGRAEINARASASRRVVDLERGKAGEEGFEGKIVKRPMRGVSAAVNKVSGDRSSPLPVSGLKKPSSSRSPNVLLPQLDTSSAGLDSRRASKGSVDQSPIFRKKVERSPFLTPTISSPERTARSPGLGEPSPTYDPSVIVGRVAKAFRRSPSSPASADLDTLLREQDDRDMTVAKLLGTRKSSASASVKSNSQSVSMASDFSLSNFPTPPAVNRNPSKKPSTFPKPLLLSRRAERAGQGAVIVDDDVFTLVPPNWKKEEDTPRTDSYSSLAAAPVDYKIPDASQWDITSFIRGTNSPIGPLAEPERRTSTDDTIRPDDVSVYRYASAVASSAALPTPGTSEVDVDEMPEIGEVKQTLPIRRLVPSFASQRAEQGDTSDEEVSDAVRTGIPGPVPLPVPTVPLFITTEIAPVFPVERLTSDGAMPRAENVAGRPTPIPTRPLAGLGSLSTQLRSRSDNLHTSTDPQRRYERPRPAPSPRSGTPSEPADANTLASGRGGASPSGLI